MAMNRETIGNIGLLALVAIGLWYMAFYALPESLTKTDRAECIKWQSWSIQYRDFYLTPAEADQCRAVGVPELAPIRRD